MESPDNLIRTPKAARMLGLDRSTLTRWVKDGKIQPAMTVPGYKGAYLFDPEAIREIVEERSIA